MKAITIDRANSLAFSEIPVPDPGETEVLIRVDTITLCGSDLHLFDGTYNGPRNYPIRFGHEWSGTVVKTGPGVADLSAGDRVTGDCSRYCGSCDLCALDRNLCSRIEKFGITVDGASAEYVVRERKYLYRLPGDVASGLGSLAEPFAVSSNLLERIDRVIAGGLAGKKVLVCGAGGIGLGALLLLKYRYGCAGVSVLEVSPFRLKTALALGASEDAGRAGGREGDNYADLYAGADYDAVVETTGNAGVFASAFGRVGPLGVVGCLGMMAEATIPQRLVVLKALTVVGSIGGTGRFPEVIDFLSRHGDEAAKLVTHGFPADGPESVKAAFAAAKDGGKAIKVQLTF